ncbi:hypothetical protein L1987_60093 [Smallanthus sonchifolius]|uniref:Uncharacterized protein n=1 Tax=Smallanthus sonchifolius TaxID=185202 RepID=A0ACB9D767_9ASTR|nr:hypothetical protein L1987_60093 [Smallanthus sonchifolius]
MEKETSTMDGGRRLRGVYDHQIRRHQVDPTEDDGVDLDLNGSAPPSSRDFQVGSTTAAARVPPWILTKELRSAVEKAVSRWMWWFREIEASVARSLFPQWVLGTELDS